MQSENPRVCLKCSQVTNLRTLFPCSKHHSLGGQLYVRLRADVFLYDEVLTGTNIRLIYIEKGFDVDEIHINLKVATVGTRYHALSYVWGDSSRKKYVICNSCPIEIQENLYNALWQIRQDGEVSVGWWVDALCINQSNDSEKTEQVRMMRDIYKGAHIVRAWIGLEKEQDVAGFALLRKIGERYGHNIDDTATALQIAAQPRHFDTLEELGLPGAENPQWKAVVDILYRDYFFRVWIIQEFLVGQRCTIRCGAQSMDRRDLLAIGLLYELFASIQYALMSNILPKGYKDGNPTSQMIATGTSHFQVFSARDLWLFSVSLADLSIAFLLSRTATYEATRPVDKVFALVGLSYDMSTSIINYSKSEALAAIEIEVALNSIKQDGTWGPMLFSGVNAIGHSTDIPSWIPDWIGAPLYNSSLVAYNLGKPQLVGPVWWTIDTNNAIHLEGQVFDTLESIVHQQPFNLSLPHLTNPSNRLRYAQDMVAWNRECLDQLASLPKYHTGERTADAFWRTLVCNRETKGVPATADLKTSYSWWIIELQIFALWFESLERSDDQTRNERIALTNTILPSILRKSNEASQRFDSALSQYAPGRKFFKSKKGYIGWVPTAAQEGDVLCRFEHCWLPFVIRPGPDGYRLIGDSYVHGFMDRQPDQSQVPLRTIKLV